LMETHLKQSIDATVDQNMRKAPFGGPVLTDLQNVDETYHRQ
jgi:hypothetical protein